MKVAVTYPDPEVALVDLLEQLLDDEDCTVSVGVPDDWTPSTGNHVEVALDGTPVERHPIAIMPTLRVVAHTATPSEAKRLALLCQGLLLAHPGGDPVGSIRPGTGLLVARDPDTRAELASFTVRTTLRSTLI